MKIIKNVFDKIFVLQTYLYQKKLFKRIRKTVFINSNSKELVIHCQSWDEKKVYPWSEVKNIEFRILNESIIITTFNDKVEIIQDNYVGWHDFLHSIPKGYDQFDYQYVQEIFSNMDGCEICGLVSVKNGECFNCKNEAWNKDSGYIYDSKEEFLVENQLEYFSVLAEMDSDYKINNNDSDKYQPDHNWMPIIKQNQITKVK